MKIITVIGCLITLPKGYFISSPCSPTLINGLSPTEYTFVLNNLKCNSDKAISIKNNLFAELECHPVNGWTEKGTSTKIFDSTEAITIACKDKNTCDISLLTDFDANEMTYSLWKEVKCKEAKELHYESDILKRTKRLRCGEDFWEAMDDSGIFQSTQIFNNASVNLKKCEIAACDQALVKPIGSAAPIFQYINFTKAVVVKCPGGKEVWINNKLRLNVTCNNVWYLDRMPFKQAHEEISVECKDPPPCNFKRSHHIIFSNEKELSCKSSGEVKRAIIYNKKAFSKLLCDESKNEWTDAEGNSIGAPLQTLLSANCRSYCVPSQLSMYLDWITNDSYKEYKCAKTQLMTMSDSKVGNVRCSLEGGWMRGTEVIEKDSTVNIPLTCENYKCEKSSPLNSTCDSSWKECSPIPFGSPYLGYYECVTGNIFYKQASAVTFEEGETNIYCIFDQGFWRVIGKNRMAVYLKTGDNVVCATMNPVPISANKVCEKCPSLESMKYQCKECSKLSGDIELKQIDLDKCVASSITSGFKIVTEKKGIVEGHLECDYKIKKWVYNGSEVGRFAAFIGYNNAKAQSSEESTVVGLTVGGTFIILIAIAIILVLYLFKKRRIRIITMQAYASEEKIAKPSTFTTQTQDTKSAEILQR